MLREKLLAEEKSIQTHTSQARVNIRFRWRSKCLSWKYDVGKRVLEWIFFLLFLPWNHFLLDWYIDSTFLLFLIYKQCVFDWYNAAWYLSACSDIYLLFQTKLIKCQVKSLPTGLVPSTIGTRDQRVTQQLYGDDACVCEKQQNVSRKKYKEVFAETFTMENSVSCVPDSTTVTSNSLIRK